MALFSLLLFICNFVRSKKVDMLSILIIEDDITFSLMLKTWLGKKGFVVESASLIQEAKRKIADTKFDLIISDLRLPDGSIC